MFGILWRQLFAQIFLYIRQFHISRHLQNCPLCGFHNWIKLKRTLCRIIFVKLTLSTNIPCVEHQSWQFLSYFCHTDRDNLITTIGFKLPRITLLLPAKHLIDSLVIVFFYHCLEVGPSLYWHL